MRRITGSRIAENVAHRVLKVQWNQQEKCQYILKQGSFWISLKNARRLTKQFLMGIQCLCETFRYQMLTFDTKSNALNERNVWWYRLATSVLGSTRFTTLNFQPDLRSDYNVAEGSFFIYNSGKNFRWLLFLMTFLSRFLQIIIMEFKFSALLPESKWMWKICGRKRKVPPQTALEYCAQSDVTLKFKLFGSQNGRV